MTATVFPSKKALTDDMRDAIDASNAPRNSPIPEDLFVALQSVGSRVRKNVTEGYNTHGIPTFTVPATPRPSPAKSANTQSTPTPAFITAKDAFNDAFNSVFPSGSPRVPLTPSPKKRTRAQVDLDDVGTIQNLGGDVEMTGSDSESDDESMDASSLPRAIKPLRRGMPRHISSSDDPFTLPGIATNTNAAPSLAAPTSDNTEMDLVSDASSATV